MRTNNQNQRHFGIYIRLKREELGLSLRQLEARTGIPNSRLSRWEQGHEMPDQPERLNALATGLNLNLADLYAYAGIPTPTALPGLAAYLHQRYGHQLPDDALAEIQQRAEAIARRYGTTLDTKPPEPGRPAHGTTTKRKEHP